MKRFVELARLGGYVWADFRSGVTRFAKVGRVVPGTRVRLVNARWTDTGTPQVQAESRNDGETQGSPIARCENYRAVETHEHACMST